jgi:hypothetical protein
MKKVIAAILILVISLTLATTAGASGTLSYDHLTITNAIRSGGEGSYFIVTEGAIIDFHVPVIDYGVDSYPSLAWRFY